MLKSAVGRVALFVASFCAIAALAAGSANADPPTQTTTPIGGTFVLLNCNGFSVSVTYTGTRRTTDYVTDGTVTKQIAHISYTGTLTNTVSGASLPYEGHFVRTRDASGALTITGLQNRALLPSGGTLGINAGRIVLATDGDTISDGRHDFDAQVCAALG